MFGTLKARVLIIFAVLVLAGWQVYSNGINYGLDLQGGMHLVLEVEDPDNAMTPEAKRDATDQALHILRTRIDHFGVEQPVIQRQGDYRIIVELPGVADHDRAKDIIQQAAFLEWKLVRSPREVIDVLPRIDRAIVEALGPEGLPERTPDVVGEELRDLLFRGVEDTVPTDPDTVPPDTVEVPPEDTVPVDPADRAADDRPLTSLLMGGEGEFLVAPEDVELVNAYLSLPEVQRLLPRGTRLHWSATPESRGATPWHVLYLLEDRAFLTGERLVNATAGRDPQFNQTTVNFELDRRGGREFERVTAANIDERIAIVLDGEVYSAPVVRARIGSRGVIEMGQAPMEEARDLALVLRAGALPAPLEILDERSVGPTLGADSVRQGQIAGMVGIILVIFIMLAYYRFAGLLAVTALGAYVIMVLGMLAGFNATLTLPGIAGLILSIGMAVDANVLIFERIREEVLVGRTTRMAVDEGFKNAMSAIVDANLTTLMTAFILFQVGTGPVRGFAVTLSIGIIASFFTAVFITRTLFRIYLERKRGTGPISI